MYIYKFIYLSYYISYISIIYKLNTSSSTIGAVVIHLNINWQHKKNFKSEFNFPFLIRHYITVLMLYRQLSFAVSKI